MPHKVHKIVLFVNTFCVTSDGIGDWLILEKMWLGNMVEDLCFYSSILLRKKKNTKH